MTRVIILVLFAFCITPALADDAPKAETSAEEAKEGFVSLFDGKTFDGWRGAVKKYKIEDGAMVCKPGGDVFTKNKYADFILRFEFKLPPGGNNGVAIRCPLEGTPAYAGVEIQILDDGHPMYKDIEPYQMHGSIYGVVPAKRGALKPVGQWNEEEIVADGSRIKVTLNGKVIVDADIGKIEKTLDGRPHPGLHNASGHIGWIGHGDPVAFRNVRIKELGARDEGREAGD
ncbi:MAG: DUF1080 domain-containing protein [Pirellulales bacterium]|nr:DUF1080 domain-containing protein [Pirellulales bacterium]